MTPPSCQTLRVCDCTLQGPADVGCALFTLRLAAPLWNDFTPGQFVMLRPENWGLELTWARPFSICQADDSGLTLFIQIVGRGTARLAGLKPGDAVTVWGPLGNGFALEPATPTLLLAGGVGIAPFVGYALRHPAPERLHFVFGHRPDIASYPYASIAGRVVSEHFQERRPEDIGRFVELLGARMLGFRDGMALACGPLPFLRTVQRLAQELGVRAQLSLENKMACGVGACLGCVASDDTGWPVQVCTHGPVFWSDRVVLEGV